ncbi:unnamed protein product, partial [Staurois parvus]
MGPPDPRQCQRFQMVSPPLCETEVIFFWGGVTNNPMAIGDHGAPVSSPTLKPHPKKPMKGTRDTLLTPGPQAVPECPKWSVCPCLQPNVS